MSIKQSFTQNCFVNIYLNDPSKIFSDTFKICDCAKIKIDYNCQSIYNTGLFLFKSNLTGDTTSFSNDYSPLFCPTDTGLYTQLFRFYLASDSFFNGFSETKWRLLVLNCPPAAAFSSNDSICEGGSIVFENKSRSVGEYEWYFEGGSVSYHKGKNPPTLSYPSTGSFEVMQIITNELGADTLRKRVHIFPNIATNNTNQTISAEYGEAVTLSACGEGDSYTWSPVLATNQSKITVKPEKTVSEYTCNINTLYGCTAICGYTVTVNGIVGTLYVPNAFSPNGDNRNDEFQLFGKAIKLHRLQIFNRWGELVFETNDITRTWDGSYKGEQQPSAIYIVQISYFSGIDLNLKNYKSSLTLIR